MFLARLVSISRLYFIVSLLLFAFLSKRNGRAPCNSADYPGFIYLFFSHLKLGACARFDLANCDWLGRIIAFYQVFFQQGRVALGKWCISTQKGQPPLPHPQDSRDGFILYSAQSLFCWPRVDLARLIRRACSPDFWIISFEFVKVCWIRFFIWESFIAFYICCYSISTILACLFFVEVRISWKKLCWNGAWRRRWHLVSPTLYIITVHRVNLNKLSRNLFGAFRTTTTNCRVSFIDLYLVFPRNFRIVFLPHTNTAILLEPNCGTITEPGLPVGQACHLEH